MKISFTAAPERAPEEALASLEARYGNVTASHAEVIVALGGDGLMLKTLRDSIGKDTPIYGMNMGTTGFLMNAYEEENLVERIEKARRTVLHPLRMRAETEGGETREALAVNEVSFLRQSPQTGHFRIYVDEKMRMERLQSDGVLIATPAGSTAYNLSAQGPIIPIEAPLLALTPISAFRPRRWRGALLPAQSRVRIETLDPKKRPVSAVADHFETPHLLRADIHQDMTIPLFLLFDDTHSLEERIISEQFRP